MSKKRIVASLLFIAGGAAVILICTFFGAADVTIKDTLMILVNKTFGGFSEQVEALGSKATIIWSLRFPRSLLAFLTGGALAVCGGVYQAIFKNPMAKSIMSALMISGLPAGSMIGRPPSGSGFHAIS